MFEREHHVRVASILRSLDSELLAASHCLFGGGTAIALARGEYRESQDIDFLVSDRDGYRELRHRLTGRQGIANIARSGAELTQAREVRADQYGLRTMLVSGDRQIKFEIVFEGRVELARPAPTDRICGVDTLTPLDMATTKLLANADRWADDSVFSRDLIDLAMLDLPRPLLKKAREKAVAAYGSSVETDLGKAITRLAKRRERLDECMSALKIDRVPKALLWQRIRRLRPK